MSYDFRDIESKWQKKWAENQTFKAENTSDKPPYYVLDMFPYPSGAGLHVGHPLGYIASDIYARYKRHTGYNVLHPQGYDSFGLPAEQYAIQTGQHPARTTEENINRYRQQLDQMGFSFDWSREVRTSNPDFYRWTQWIFIQLFDSWYDTNQDKARPIAELITYFEEKGTSALNATHDTDAREFTADQWKAFTNEEQQQILLHYRLTYLAETEVNWCPALGTVLANDEIINGVSERGGHTVVRKKMRQWSMRITAYAERLLQGLDTIDWPQPLKDSQTNWIGKSVGAMVEFRLLSQPQSFPEGREDSSFGSEDKSHPGYLTGNPDISRTLIERAKKMRSNPTPAEKLLWSRLRDKQSDYKFRRQHPIDNYIVDFVCLRKKLIIEVDGEIHQFQQEKDQERQLLLEKKLGYKVLRFTNDQVLNSIEDVVIQIKETANKITSSKENTSSPETLFVREDLDSQKVLPQGEDLGGERIRVFTTRPDTIFGVTFMTLAPEHELVQKITTPEQQEDVDAYIEETAKRSERERMADVKSITGVFTGAYAEHPFTKKPVPIWIGDYVLASYGTGAVMAVPCGDQRDYDFANHFAGQKGMPEIVNIFKDVDISEEAFASKEKTIIANSDFLDGLEYKEASRIAIETLEVLGQGKKQINYRLRDAVFSRQRYWGEPFPVYYVNDLPQMIDEQHLPLRLPEIEKYLPTETGEPPLGRAQDWAWNTEKNEVVSKDQIDHKTVFPLELNTMPGWAGSSWYLFRYMDPQNDTAFASEEALHYWKNVDLYIGGSEHATGHLLYSRFWTKFLHDRGWLPVNEPFKKLINQGMILGESAFAYGFGPAFESINKLDLDPLPKFVIPKKSYERGKKHELDAITDKIVKDIIRNRKEEGFDVRYVGEQFNGTFIPFRVNISYLKGLTNNLDIDSLKKDSIFDFVKDATFILNEDNEYVVHREVEKMSKSKFNVVNPDEICEQYGADTLRMYEMFLGPLDQAKPWNTAGITGVHSFLNKLWRLYHNGEEFAVTDIDASAESMKTLHKTIQKVTGDIENFSFNTSVSTFMIAINELTTQKCSSRQVLEPLAILIAPYAPHIAEEFWNKLGHTDSITFAPFPKFEEKYVVESNKEYPISFNGKKRFTLNLPLDLSKEEIEKTVMAHEKTQEQLAGRTPKKVIVVPGKIINIVG